MKKSSKYILVAVFAFFSGMVSASADFSAAQKISAHFNPAATMEQAEAAKLY